MRPNDDPVRVRDRRIGLWVFLLGTLFYLTTTSGERYTGDGDLVAWVAEGIVDHGSICIDRGRAANTYRLEDGCRVTDYGLGTSLVLVPGVVLIRMVEALGLDQGVVYTMLKNLIHYLAPSALGGLIWLFFFMLAVRLSGDRRRALWLTVIVGTTTTIWYYARTVFSEGPQTCALLGCLTALYWYKNHGGKTKHLAGGALAFGFLVMIKASNWLLLPLLVAYLAWGRWRESLRPLSVFLGVVAPFVLYQFWFNYFRFGDILDFGYHTGRDQELGYAHPLFFGIWGYLFSPSKSFFLYSPVALFALWGWKRFFGRHRPEALLFIGITVVTVCLYASWWAWHGDWSWGPRFLVPLVPLAALPAVFLFPGGLSKRPFLRGAVTAAALLALWVQFLGGFVPTWKYLGTALNSTQVSFPRYGWKLGGSIHKPVDTQIPVHYLPQFSPILGHYWLLKHLVPQDPELSRDHPWKSLQIEAWKPREVGLHYGLDWWGNAKLPESESYPPHSVVFAVIISLLLGAAAAFCAFRIHRLLAPGVTPGSGKDPA